MASMKVVSLGVFICMMVVFAPYAEAAVTCGQVTSTLAPCITYLTSKGGAMVPPRCCSGVKSLNNAAKTTPDRQAACNCMKSTAAALSGLNLNNAAGLPMKCGVNIPYKISPSINCKTVK